MSAQLALRSTFMLYAAMALAVAAGLSALPPLDPLEVLREQGGAWGLLTALLHLGLAGLGFVQAPVGTLLGHELVVLAFFHQLPLLEHH